MLGQDTGDWEFRMLPNKLLELVKNVGNMEQRGTGFFLESESEMLTILNFLNYGEETNITESMKVQVLDAIKHMDTKQLEERDDAERYQEGAGTLIGVSPWS